MLKSIKRRLQGAVLPAVFLAICAYFAHHAISGSRGTEARAVRMAQIEDARSELRLAEAERDAMDRRVAGLRAEHLDRDMLDAPPVPTGSASGRVLVRRKKTWCGIRQVFAPVI